MTDAAEYAARSLFQAQRTGEPEALSLLSRQQAAARFRAHNTRANDYANHLAALPADPVEARRQENEIGNAHYSHS